MTGLATEEDSALASADSEVLVLTAGTDAANGTTLTVFENESRYFLRSSAYEPLFSISSSDAEELLEGAGALDAAGALPGGDDSGGAASESGAASDAASP